MMRKNKKLKSIFLITALVAVFMTGCDKSADDTDSGEVTTAQVVSEVTAAEEDVNPTEEFSDNLISNSAFDTDINGWESYTEGGGIATLSHGDGQLTLNVLSIGTVNYAVQVFSSDAFTLEQNKTYSVKFDISCTENRNIEVMLAQNGGSYQSHSWNMIAVTPETQSVEFTFDMKEATDDNARFLINCGNQGEDVSVHTIYLDNVSVTLVDNEGVSKSSEEYEPAIRADQLGYKTNSSKNAVLCDITEEKEFAVINAESGETVYTGELEAATYSAKVHEMNCVADFSEVTEAGSYYIACGDVKSHTFKIEEGTELYNDILNDTIGMFYLQRCGCEVISDKIGHQACHTGEAQIYGTEEMIDVSGGWHDAGDYGRYVVPAAKTVADLLYAYDAMGNSDLLDEVRYELEWMLKMQASSGGVYHKVTCASFPGYVMPEEETAQLIVTPVSTTATADFCASMALAYEFYYDSDRAFADTCLTAAERAWLFLEENPELIFENPSDISTGDYGDESDTDERYWAAAQMYRATKDSVYLEALEKMEVQTGMEWHTVGDYGNIALLTMKDADKSLQVYKRAYKAVTEQAELCLEITENNIYGAAVSEFYWGSNAAISNEGALLALAYNITGEEKYLTAAEANLHYLLGLNPVDTCFVSGYGTVFPTSLHHRPTQASGQCEAGMLVGGVNSNLEDPTAQALLKDAPPYKCYVDDNECYSVNEVCICWNSPFIYLLALTMNN